MYIQSEKAEKVMAGLGQIVSLEHNMQTVPAVIRKPVFKCFMETSRNSVKAKFHTQVIKLV